MILSFNNHLICDSNNKLATFWPLGARFSVPLRYPPFIQIKKPLGEDLEIIVPEILKWFKKKEESIDSIDDGNVCAGVMFSLRDADQRREISELVGLLKGGTACCRECNASVSGEAAFCYNCGAKIPRKRAFLKKMLNTLLAGPDDPDYS